MPVELSTVQPLIEAAQALLDDSTQAWRPGNRQRLVVTLDRIRKMTYTFRDQSGERFYILGPVNPSGLSPRVLVESLKDGRKFVAYENDLMSAMPVDQAKRLGY